MIEDSGRRHRRDLSCASEQQYPHLIPTYQNQAKDRHEIPLDPIQDQKQKLPGS